MAKILLEVKESAFPKDNDIIVYNKSLGLWEVVSQDVYFKNIKAELKKFEERVKCCEEKSHETQERVKEIAQIVKEGIK